MITPTQQNETFLEDVAAARSEPGRLHIWWLGRIGFLVQWQDNHLLFDPYLSDPCHFDMFAFNTASPELFVETCKSLNQLYRVLRAGERWSSEPNWYSLA